MLAAKRWIFPKNGGKHRNQAGSRARVSHGNYTGLLDRNCGRFNGLRRCPAHWPISLEALSLSVHRTMSNCRFFCRGCRENKYPLPIREKARCRLATVKFLMNALRSFFHAPCSSVSIHLSIIKGERRVSSRFKVLPLRRCPLRHRKPLGIVSLASFLSFSRNFGVQFIGKFINLISCSLNGHLVADS